MEKIHYKSLPEKTADVLQDLLYRENYRVGAKLPSEPELARRLEVSRNTVRQAIKILVGRDLLEVQRGSGTFVSGKLGMSDDPLGLALICDKEKLVLDMLDVRLMLEPRMAALAAENATAGEIRQLEDICRRMEKVCRDGENYYQMDMEFHTFIAGCSRNLVIHSLYPAIRNTILLQENVVQNRLGEKTLAAHRRIYQAIAAHKGTEAADAMTLHLVQNRERILEKQDAEKED